MKIIAVGASGTIGKHVVAALGERHEVVRVGHSRGDILADITNQKSLEEMFAKVGAFDALVCTAGEVHFGPLSDFSEEHFYQGIRSKMMGQINLVLLGQKTIRKGGSFTLTSGILTHDPIRAGAGASAVNGALEAFARSAAIELIDKSVRINVVSPGVVADSAANYGPFFPGHIPVAMDRVAMGYLKAIEGFSTGKVIEIF